VPSREGEAPPDGSLAEPGAVDSGCPPDAAAPVASPPECNPLDRQACGLGQACYPTVRAPSHPCGDEIYRAVCAREGTRRQGQPCEAMNDCAASFVCVDGTDGLSCKKLCLPGETHTCPPGTLCLQVDIAEYGVCA
jgi:hypothetical protein